MPTQVLAQRPQNGHVQKQLFVPAHLPTSVWKSKGQEEKDEYFRVVKKVKYIAPDYVKSGMFPQNVDEWRKFKHGKFQDQIEQKEKEKAITITRIDAVPNIPEKGRKIQSTFGQHGKCYKQDGGIFKDGYGPVTMFETIWSEEYAFLNRKRADWPTHAELLMHGDNRDMNYRTQRSLPYPREPARYPEQSYIEQNVMGLNPLDEVEAPFTLGPEKEEYTKANAEELDNEPYFNMNGEGYMGKSLMDIIGRKDYTVRTPVPKPVQKQEEEYSRPVRRRPPRMPGPRPATRRRQETQMQEAQSAQVDGPYEVQVQMVGQAMQDFQTENPHYGATVGDAQYDDGTMVSEQVVTGYEQGDTYGNGYGYGYHHQMPDGTYGYPQHDGTWYFYPGRP